MLEVLLSVGIPEDDARLLLEVFAANRITLDLLPLLNERVMDKMAIPLGYQLRLSTLQLED